MCFVEKLSILYEEKGPWYLTLVKHWREDVSGETSFVRTFDVEQCGML